MCDIKYGILLHVPRRVHRVERDRTVQAGARHRRQLLRCRRRRFHVPHLLQLGVFLLGHQRWLFGVHRRREPYVLRTEHVFEELICRPGTCRDLLAIAETLSFA